jgi:hypothetical protein
MMHMRRLHEIQGEEVRRGRWVVVVRGGRETEGVRAARVGQKRGALRKQAGFAADSRCTSVRMALGVAAGDEEETRW